MKGKLTKVMMVAMMLATVLGLAASLVTSVSTTTTVSAATDKWSRMDLPTTLNYQMLPDSVIWDLTAGDDGTLFALVEDTTTDLGNTSNVGIMKGGRFGSLNWTWDGLRWAVYPAYSDVAVFKSTTGGCSWTLCWHVPSSETGAPVAIVPQPGYTDSDTSKDTIFVAMGTRYLNGSPIVLTNYAGGLSEGNIYRSTDGCGSFTRVTPRCPAVTLANHGPNTGGTITSLDVVECPVCSQGCQNPFMAIVGVSSLNTSTGGATGGCGEGVWTWNQNGVAIWNDLQVSNSMVAPPTPGTMPAGNGLDVIQVYGSRNYPTDGCIMAVANDILGTDPALEPAGVYVCFYDANDGIWGGDIDSPTTATRPVAAVPSWLSGEYAGAASMDTGTDFNSVTSCYVFVGLDGCTVDLRNNDLWRVRGLATVTGPSTVTSCNVYNLLINPTGANPANGGKISDVLVPGEAATIVYVGCQYPQGQAQELGVTNAITWATPMPSFKPTSGAFPVLLANSVGTVFAAGGGDGYTSSGVSKMYTTARGTAFNGIGLLDDIAVSEDIPGFNSSVMDAYGYGTWCLVEAVAEEVSPLYDQDGYIYVTTSSDWDNNNIVGFGSYHDTSLSLWRLTNGCWERIMVYCLHLPDGSIFEEKSMYTHVCQDTFVRDVTWWPRVTPQFSTDASMFVLGGKNSWITPKLQELIWYSPDKGNDFKAMPQMPIGALGWGTGVVDCEQLSESGWWVQDSNTLFVGDCCGFIYKTTNRGASWTDGVLTGLGLEIDMICCSPIYSDTGAAGTDKCVLVGTLDDYPDTFTDEVWLSQDGCAMKDLENIGDEIYTDPMSWSDIHSFPRGGTVVNFDKNWATTKIVYAVGGGWLDRWQLVGPGAGGTVDLNRIDYTDASIVRTVVDLNDPSASTWEHLWDADDWNALAPKPQPYTGMTVGNCSYRVVLPSGLQIGPDGTVYVAFSIWDSSYNNGVGAWAGPGDTPSPNYGGRWTMGGVLRCLDGTLKTTEWENCQDGRGPWDGLWMNRAVAGNTHLISLTWDWKEWRFKLAFWEDTLSGAGPAPVSPVTGAQGVGALVSDTSVNVPLSWQAKGGASLYEWQVSEDSAFTNPKTGTTSDLSVTVLDLKPATNYYWRVRAEEPMLCRWDTAQQFTTVIGGETGAPQLITPEIGSTITDKSPLFTWSGVASATNYQIQVATSPTFGAADIVINKTLGNVQAYEAENDLVNGTYYWQVKSTNSDTDTETPWSQLGSFTLNTAAGGTSTPAWVWVLIVLGVVLGVVVLVLILRTRRPV